MSGWVKLHRSIVDWEWYQDANTMRSFIHCLCKANWKDKRWKGQTIERGSFFTSYSNFGNEIGLTTQQTRTCFSKLKSTGEITVKSTGFGLLLTVCNYALYNDLEDEKQQAEQQAEQQSINRRATGEQQGDNRQVTTTKEREEDKEDSISIRAGFPEKQTVLDYCESQGWDIKEGLAFWLHFDQAKSNGDRAIGPNWHWWSRLEQWVMESERRNQRSNAKTRRNESNSNRGTANEGKASEYAL